MYLLAAATKMETKPLLAKMQGVKPSAWAALELGVGPMEAALSLSRYLLQKNNIEAIIHFGVAGAYYRDDGAQVLDICLAEEEIMGDLGICFADKIERLEVPGVDVHDRFSLAGDMLLRAEGILSREKTGYKKGKFVTVNGVSGSRSRGDFFVSEFGALCENMEGAAVARVAAEFDIPCVEVRVVSNMVEDRNLSSWKLKEACGLSGRVAALLAREFISKDMV